MYIDEYNRHTNAKLALSGGFNPWKPYKFIHQILTDIQ